MNKRAWCPVWFTVVLFGLSFAVAADEHNKCKTNIGKVLSKQGSVVINRAATGKWERVRQSSEVCEGDTIRTGSRSRAAVSLVNQTVMRINQKSTAKMENFSLQEEARSVLRLISGIIQFFSRKPKNYQIETVTATIGIRGTEFVVVADDNKTEVTVFEGVVQAENDTVPLALSAGETVSIVGGQSMRSTVMVNPRDQVQWGLYYPPVLSVSEISDPSLQNTKNCVDQGDYACAFEALEGVSSADQNDDYFYLNAALLVAVGQTEEADAIINDLLLVNSNDATALALRSVIAVSQNMIDDARDDAVKAVESSPNSLSARIALSYAQQADLDLSSATETMQQAVNSHPDSALAKARLAELLLATGHVADASKMAESATGSGSDSARAHTVLGYTALAQIDADMAIKAFNRALEIDSADPQPHLGLGLALIRNGELEAGRGEIEAAVALDSNSAILRSYLGRAYYEENRPPLDADQYAIAKQLDDNDPTAYLFDAIRKHSENRPVEAMQDLQASIERNDNRAVYRSRNLLDQDRAARGSSLARIYDTLGFTNLGIVESGNSLAIDPANESAHRFLSDSYRNIRRREISRVSELLQAQMLQDVNLNPVQPSVSATNLNIGTGAGDVGLNEFSGLFESNGFNPAVSLISGNNNTNGTEVVLSGVQGSISYSLGGFHFKTDGWRENNSQEQDLGNLFLQWAATPQLNLQLEVSSRDSTEGDLAFNFDADAFDPTLTNERELDSERVGLRYSPTANSDILLSHISTDRMQQNVVDGFDLVPNPTFDPVVDGFCLATDPNPDLNCNPPVVLATIPNPTFDPIVDGFCLATDPNPELNCNPPAFPFVGPIKSIQEDDGTQNEIQYIQKFNNASVVLGIYEADIDSVVNITTDNPDSIIASVVEFDVRHSKTYIYTSFSPGWDIDLTLGVSKDEYEEDPTDETETNGKLGLIWRPDSQQTLRLASFESMKPALVNNRSLEPTQIAGFNQIFDDSNGTKTSAAGIGYDFILNSNVSIGLELTRRDIEEPVVDPVRGITIFDDREESVGRFYLYWTPNNSVSMSLQAISDEYQADSSISTSSAGIPEEVSTTTIPLSIKYFSENGWFAGIKLTAVDQEVTRVVDPFAAPGTPLASGNDSFEVIDLSIGYRIPKRRGSLSLSILNAADEEFNYQDDSYREFRDEPSTGPYFPSEPYTFRPIWSFNRGIWNQSNKIHYRTMELFDKRIRYSYISK